MNWQHNVPLQKAFTLEEGFMRTTTVVADPVRRDNRHVSGNCNACKLKLYGY